MRIEECDGVLTTQAVPLGNFEKHSLLLLAQYDTFGVHLYCLPGLQVHRPHVHAAVETAQAAFPNAPWWNDREECASYFDGSAVVNSEKNDNENGHVKCTFANGKVRV